MVTLAIKGHATRGNEVIALLEMLGGNSNSGKKGTSTALTYYIDKEGNIKTFALVPSNNYIFNIYTLEEFEEKYPYKAGDKVYYQKSTSYIWRAIIATIVSMKWSGNTIIYYTDKGHEMLSRDLQPYKEQKAIDKTIFPYKIGTRVSVRNPNIKKLATIVGLSYNSCACKQYEIKFDGEDVVIHYPTDLLTPVTTEQEPTKECIDFAKHPPLTDKLEIILGNYEIVQEDGKCYAVMKSPKYPKTYEECCTILQYNDQLKVYPPFRNGIDKYSTRLFDQLENLRKLKICLDTYREIAGKELGLGKHWEPDWKDVDQDKYVIYTDGNTICTNCFYLGHNILAFPTKEMRDIFYENFKDLIEQCKELL